mmetsp:Transcript_33439/g.70293  ORF Transcript_33439/g.70293 Transcript_33439/m.70293 type:complete len:226 (+) Transcript_33439:2289-2966(+)
MPCAAVCWQRKHCEAARAVCCSSSHEVLPLRPCHPRCHRRRFRRGSPGTILRVHPSSSCPPRPREPPMPKPPPRRNVLRWWPPPSSIRAFVSRRCRRRDQPFVATEGVGTRCFCAPAYLTAFCWLLSSSYSNSRAALFACCCSTTPPSSPYQPHSSHRRVQRRRLLLHPPCRERSQFRIPTDRSTPTHRPLPTMAVVPRKQKPVSTIRNAPRTKFFRILVCASRY